MSPAAHATESHEPDTWPEAGISGLDGETFDDPRVLRTSGPENAVRLCARVILAMESMSALFVILRLVHFLRGGS